MTFSPVLDVGVSGGVGISGTVSEAGAGAVGVFLLTDTNNAAASSQADGSYDLFLAADTATNINILSNEYQADPVPVGPFPEFSEPVVNIAVRRLALVFRDGFE